MTELDYKAIPGYEGKYEINLLADIQRIWKKSGKRTQMKPSLKKGNPIIGRDVLKELNKLIYGYQLHRIEWRMIGGNPIEKSYDKICQKFNGTKHILTDAFKDKYGQYRDDIIYEIINT